METGFSIRRFTDRLFAENCYLLVGPSRRTATVVDPGFQAEEVIAVCERESLDVEWIVNTHAHIDHIAGNRSVRERTGGKLIVHPLDRPLLQGLRQQQQALESMGFALDGEVDSSPAPDALFDEGSPFVFDGVEFEVIHTPGHSPGGICLRSEKTLLVGDTLFRGSVGRTDLAGGSTPQLIQSIREKLFRLPGDTTCWPGHGDSTTIAEERKSNPFVSDHAVGAVVMER